MVPLPPQSHTSDMQATFYSPYICENVLLGNSKDSKVCRKDKKHKKNPKTPNLKTIYFNLEQNN